MRLAVIGLVICFAAQISAQHRPLAPMDLFNLEYASSPEISPNGKHIVYQRRGFDIMEDRSRVSLWLLNVKEAGQEPLVDVSLSPSAAIWSPDGTRIAYVAKGAHGRQIFVRYLASGNTSQITQLQTAPGHLSWSPDGKSIAFTNFVASSPPTLGKSSTTRL